MFVTALQRNGTVHHVFWHDLLRHIEDRFYGEGFFVALHVCHWWNLTISKESEVELRPQMNTAVDHPYLKNQALGHHLINDSGTLIYRRESAEPDT